MTQKILMIYDVKTDDDTRALTEFQKLIKEEHGFRKLQKSAYYRDFETYDYYDDLLKEIKKLPPGSKVNITVLDEVQFRQLKINRAT